MTDQPPEAPAQVSRTDEEPDLRHAFWLTVVRTVGLIVAISVLYAVGPFGGSSLTVVRVVIGVLVLAIAVGLQAVAVAHSTTPALRAAEAIIVSVVLALIVFAAIHVSVSNGNVDAYSEPLDRIDGLYLSMMTMTTVGFGDIGAFSRGARITVMSHMVVNVLVIGVAAKFMINQARRRRRHPFADPASDADHR